MTDIIYERGQRRESAIWDAFLWNGPFSAVQETQRTTLFGIYAYTYLQGHNYLQEIETEDLARLVDTYTVNMAQITNERAKLVLDVAAKYYLQNIESLLHIQKQAIREKEIDALDDDITARITALEADQEAITTKQAEVNYARDKTVLKITDLEIQADLEEVKQELIDAEKTEKEIEAARIDLRILEAGIEGLNIQLAVTQAALDIANTELQITNAENEESEMDVRISEVEIRTTEEGIRADNVALDETRSGAEKKRLLSRITEVNLKIDQTEMDVLNAENDADEIGIRISETDVRTREEGVRADEVAFNETRSVTEADRLRLKTAETTTKIAETASELDKIAIEEGEVDIRISEVEVQVTEEGIREDNVGLAEIRSVAEKQRLITRAGEVAVRVAEADLDVEEADVKQDEIQAQTKNIEADTAKLGLIDTDLVLTGAQKRIQEVENETLLDQRDLIESQGENVETETTYYEDYKTSQEELDEKLNEHEQNKSAAERDRLEQKVSQKEDLGTMERDQVHESKRTLADEKYAEALDAADDDASMYVIKAQAAVDKKNAAIQAAKDLADANIINTLTHSIGSA